MKGSLEGRIKAICSEVLRRTRPGREERLKTLRFVESLVDRLRSRLQAAGLEVDVKVQGSVAKDTWLAGEKDIDVFMMVPKVYGRAGFKRVLEVAKEVAGSSFIEAYAEHPYIQAEMDGYTVDFVPCFKVRSALEACSSVDRTPLHTQYVKGKLDERFKDEVRLLKRFMKGIDVYGAEIKVGGFSGYLCEILTLHYGGFIETLRAASRWRRRELIDHEGYYRGRENEALKIFHDDALIVIDPVDERRNLASSIRDTKLNEFIAAAREFLNRPSIEFFYPGEVRPIPVDSLVRGLTLRGSSIVFLRFRVGGLVPDVLWGQLYKSERAIRNLILSYDFKIIRSRVWSDDRENAVILYELDSHLLPPVKRHVGPPIDKREDCGRFLSKYLGAEETVSGPWIEGDRWVVEVRRRYRDVIELLRDKLADGGIEVGVARQISEAMAGSLEVLLNGEIAEFYRSSHDFAVFLTEYLRGKPRWLSRS
ncbi:CCA tRNA nucleotidyltransferase [Candidatus Bathyarchaeota archaeon]|nr:MAG: CCA tRNA nucleotidyltransferase [Candidatus Bathyarchaeota archaeon]